jgi:hypothetical protein
MPGAKEQKPSRLFDGLFIVSQVILIILYAFCTNYGDGVHPSATNAERVSVDEEDA